MKNFLFFAKKFVQKLFENQFEKYSVAGIVILVNHFKFLNLGQDNLQIIVTLIVVAIIVIFQMISEKFK